MSQRLNRRLVRPRGSGQEATSIFGGPVDAETWDDLQFGRHGTQRIPTSTTPCVECPPPGRPGQHCARSCAYLRRFDSGFFTLMRKDDVFPPFAGIQGVGRSNSWVLGILFVSVFCPRLAITVQGGVIQVRADKFVDATAGPAFGSIVAVLAGTGYRFDARRNGTTAGVPAMPSPRCRPATARFLLALLILALLPVGPLATSTVWAQNGQATQVVAACDPTQTPCNTYEFGGDWVINPDTTMEGSGGSSRSRTRCSPETSFQYFETPWVTNHIPDNECMNRKLCPRASISNGTDIPCPGRHRDTGRRHFVAALYRLGRRN